MPVWAPTYMSSPTSLNLRRYATTSAVRKCGATFRPGPEVRCTRAPLVMFTLTSCESTSGPLPAPPARNARGKGLLGRKAIEDDLRAVRRPLRRAAEFIPIAEPAQAAAIGAYHIHATALDVLPAGRGKFVIFELGIAIGGEGEPAAVGRPGWA